MLASSEIFIVLIGLPVVGFLFGLGFWLSRKIFK